MGPLRVHWMNWKVWFWELTGWRPKNDEERRRTVENLREITHRNITEAPRLGFSSRNQFFHLFQVILELPGGLNKISFHFSPPPIYRKMGEMLATPLAQASKVTSSRSNRLLEEYSGRPKWDWLLFEPPFLLSTPPAFFGDSFSVTLRNFKNFVTMLVFFP